MLSTEEVSVLLNAEGIDLSAEQVAELARNHAFPGASKPDGRWAIPAEDLAAFIGRRKTGRRRRWITAGSVGLVITVLGLLSITKDSLDLARDYILPEPTPSLPVCTVMASEGECIPVTDVPVRVRVKPPVCLPNGTQVEVIETVPGDFYPFYRLGSYVDDLGPVVVTQVLPDTPAEEVGLREGDILLRIDDLVLQDTTIRVWRDYVANKAGQPVTMLIERNGRKLTLQPVPQSRIDDTGRTYGAIGYHFDGGLREKGYGGYIPTQNVACGPSPTPVARP